MPVPHPTIDEQAAEWILQLHEESTNDALRLQFE